MANYVYSDHWASYINYSDDRRKKYNSNHRAIFELVKREKWVEVPKETKKNKIGLLME